jgi:hypothetical protein
MNRSGLVFVLFLFQLVNQHINLSWHTDEYSILCMTQFDYRRTKETKLKATYTLVEIRSWLFFHCRTDTGRGGGAMLSGGIILAQQTSTSIEGRAIKGKILKPRDVKHLTQSTRNWVCALTHQRDTNLYILLQQQLQSEWKEPPTGWVAHETVHGIPDHKSAILSPKFSYVLTRMGYTNRDMKTSGNMIQTSGIQPIPFACPRCNLSSNLNPQSC